MIRFPLQLQNITQSHRMRERMARVSREPSVYAAPVHDEFSASEGDAVTFHITPIYRTQRARNPMPNLSFSGQLLELGLKHNVEGLVKKAQEQLSYQGAVPSSAQDRAARNYERAQDNFMQGDVHMVERQF